MSNYTHLIYSIKRLNYSFILEHKKFLKTMLIFKTFKCKQEESFSRYKLGSGLAVLLS